eukprot:scaffold34602_cov216-Amphora_coffeaeformis.AAC.3
MDNSPIYLESTASNDGNDWDEIDDDEVELMASACSEGGEDEVAKLIMEHGDAIVNKKDLNGNAPIHNACQARNLSIVQMLVKHGADIVAKNGCGSSPLQIAIFGDHLDMVQLLSRKSHGKKSKRNSFDLTQSQLKYAAIFGRASILKWLLQNGADTNETWIGGRTAAHFVCALAEGNGQAVDCLNSLVEHGADLSIQDDEGRMPIHGVRSVTIMETLIDRWSVDVNVRDGKGWSPLHHAVASIGGCAEVCRFLLGKEADLHAFTDDGDAPLHLAMRHGGETATILLEQDAIDIGSKDGLGRNSLHLILTHQKPERYILHFLNIHFMPARCDVNDGTDTGWTALHYAVFYNLFDVLKVLMGAGASMSQCNFKGQTPLHMIGTKDFRLTGGEEERAVQEALDGTISPQRKYPLRDPFPLPPIDEAIFKVRQANTIWPAQHEGVYDLLVKRGADCTKRDKEGNLPFFLAASTGWLDATLCMVKAAASQGLFETLQGSSVPSTNNPEAIE